MHTVVTRRGKLGRRRLLRTWGALLAGSTGLARLGTSAAEPLRDEPAPPERAPSVIPIFKPDAPWFVPFAREPASAPAASLPSFVRPRAAWQAAAPVQPYVQQTPKGVSFHHTGAVWTGKPGSEQYLRNIQTFHTGPQREWEDIAYHFLIDLDGNVWEGRPANVRGNPSIYYDPTGLVLISYLGDYGSQELTDAQVEAGVRTAAWVMRAYGIAPSAPITGHRDHAPTSCPGANIYRLLQEGTVARRVQEAMKA